MKKWIVMILSIASISCVTIANERAPASRDNADYSKKYQKQLRDANPSQVANEAEYREHEEYLRVIDRSNRH